MWIAQRKRNASQCTNVRDALAIRCGQASRGSDGSRLGRSGASRPAAPGQWRSIHLQRWRPSTAGSARQGITQRVQLSEHPKQAFTHAATVEMFSDFFRMCPEEIVDDDGGWMLHRSPAWQACLGVQSQRIDWQVMLRSQLTSVVLLPGKLRNFAQLLALRPKQSCRSPRLNGAQARVRPT